MDRVLRTTGRPRLTFSLPPDFARLLRVRHRVADYLTRLGAPQDFVFDVVLAVHEAVANAVRHGDAGETVEVTLELEGGDLRVRIRDHGRGFQAPWLGPDEAPDPEQEAGRGLYLMSRLVDELEVCSGEGAEVRMVKTGMLEARPGRVGLGTPGSREAWARLRVEEVPEGFVALDWDYTVTYVNRRAVELYGSSAAGVVGRSLWDLFPTLGLSRSRRHFEDAMELGIASILEYDSPTLGRFVELRIYPTSSGLSFSLRDIDERKRRELGHEEARRRAELLARTTARLLSAEDPERVVDDLCRDVMQHLGCHVFFNYLVDARAGCLVLNAYAGISVEEACAIELLDFGVAVCGCAAQQAERIVAEDIQHSDDTRADLARSYGVQAYVAHPLLARGEVIGTLSFGARDRPRFTEDELAVMKTVADQVAIAMDRERAEHELRRREVEAAAKDERSRLARDLHDSVTQALFAASLEAEALALGDGDVSPEVARAVEQVRRLNRGALAQMRTMLLELRDEPLEAVPVQQLLRNLVEATESRASTDVALTVAGDVPLTRQLHVAVYRIAQEALNNVVRHARAAHAWVELELEPGAGRLVIGDDGRGFDLSTSDPSAADAGAPDRAFDLRAPDPSHLGIRSMRERAQEAGADLRVESEPGAGTTVTLWWPPGAPGQSG